MIILMLYYGINAISQLTSATILKKPSNSTVHDRILNIALTF